MGELKELDQVREQAEKCVRCGMCLYTCPVYGQTGEEGYVARGRNRLLSEVTNDYRDLTAGLKDRFSKCLLCRRCTMVCPQGVRTDLLTVAARAEIVKGKGLPFYKSVAFRRLLKDRKRMRKALKAASKLQWVLPSGRKPKGALKHIPLQAEGKIRHIPVFLAGLGGGRHLPPIADKSLGEELPEISPALGKTGKPLKRVAYFSGCATEFALPKVGKALVRMLNELGVEVLFPKEQGCCGLAVLGSGDLETAREMALHNMKVLEGLDVDCIVTACATCGSTLKEGWAAHLAKNKDEKRRFEQFGARVKDITELLSELQGHKPTRFRSRLPKNTIVTYHDPCHLARYQGITEEPRKILKAVFGKNFVEMDDVGCCGMGGSFNIDHYELSKKVAKKKLDSIARTKADVVVNDCPGCMIQLIDGIERDHLPQKVVHLVEAIEPIPDSKE